MPYLHILVWIAFGLIVGLLAKALMPGRDPGGVVFTGVLGIAGALLGNFLLYKLTGKWLGVNDDLGNALGDSLSIPGIAVAVVGAFLLLAGHRLVFGRARRR